MQEKDRERKRTIERERERERGWSEAAADSKRMLQLRNLFTLYKYIHKLYNYN